MPITICQECYQVLQPAVTLCPTCRAMRIDRPLEPPGRDGDACQARAARVGEARLVAGVWMSALLGDSDPEQVLRVWRYLRKRLAEDACLRQELRTLAPESGTGATLRAPQDTGSSRGALGSDRPG